MFKKILKKFFKILNSHLTQVFLTEVKNTLRYALMGTQGFLSSIFHQ